MALTLNAEQKSIYDIFSGENQYIIPPYQRAYSWTQTHCKALFEDIRKAFYSEEKEGYFLGNIVLAKSREERNKLEVIDGQQRLTTLILLIKVLLSFDKENKALYNAIWIKDRRTDEEIQRLETNVFMEKDYNYFKEVLAFDFSDNICESVSEKENLFKQNICCFYSELKEFSQNNDIFKFSDFLLDKIYILPIETEDSNADKARQNALNVFETINNRGLNLSTSDIFKARLYSMALNELEHEEFIIEWKELEEKCNNLNYKIDDIFKIYSYTIQHENNLTINDNNLREFFLEKKYSPFLLKNQKIIMTELLSICEFIRFFIDVIQNPKGHQELSKWFQIIHQGVLIGLLDEKFFYIYFSLIKYNTENYNDLVNLSKEMIYQNHFLKEESVKDKKGSFFGKNNLVTKELFFLLIGLFLDEKKEAIYPYYVVNNLIKSYPSSYAVKIKENDFTTINKIMISQEFLTQFYPELKDNKRCIELINKAYKFIRESNEN